MSDRSRALYWVNLVQPRRCEQERLRSVPRVLKQLVGARHNFG